MCRDSIYCVDKNIICVGKVCNFITKFRIKMTGRYTNDKIFIKLIQHIKY